MSGIFFLPESPRHLIYTDREDVARRVIAELNSVSVDDEIVESSISELKLAIEAENEGGKATWMECFSTRNSLWKRTGNGMMLQFIQQLNGQNFYCELHLTCYAILTHISIQTTTATLSSRVREQRSFIL
jgi:MFS transporter, SP family, sugar:H+ symporter